MQKTICFLFCFGGLVFFLMSPLRADDGPSFNRDIRPILAAKCFACHGPDEKSREADLRLDSREAALDAEVIKPGKPDESEMIRRINSDDPDEKMPPAESNETLSAEQKELLRKWIAAGAQYDAHWAFVSPTRPAVPEVADSKWPRVAIDHFILARLEKEKQTPSPEADRYTLVRRLYLDLIGMPPLPEEADAFVADKDPKAYEKLVGRLLNSKHYGERWARQWLDLARYSDTNGYEKDRPRPIWPYRDWVVRALNADMPFDQFTIEQLAGDMLPDATPAQKIATGFHRNTMLNEEGGIDPLEYRFYAMVDRVATTGTVWLGLTTGCAQCHSHKFDPITHTDFYQMMALLNNADEPDLIVEDAAIKKRREATKVQIAKMEADLPNHFPPAAGEGPMGKRRQQNLREKFNKWLDDAEAKAVTWRVLRPTKMSTNLPRLTLLEDGSIFSTGDITKRDVFDLKIQIDSAGKPVSAIRLEVLPDARLPARGPGRTYYEGRKGDFFLSEMSVELGGSPLKFSGASHSYGKISIGSGDARATSVIDGNGSTGWSTSGGEGKPHQLVLNLTKPVVLKGEMTVRMLFERHFAASLGRFRISVTTSKKTVKAQSTPVEIEALLARGNKTWSNQNKAQLRHHFLRVAPELAEARKKIDQLTARMPAYPTTMVMQERPPENPRPTFRHHRGEFLSRREKVSLAVPVAFASLPTGQPANRLAFARWLVSERNPLVGRVTVNRAWQAFFGTGLVSTSGDFGTQGDPPSHPQLLDWLASEFVKNKWSMKELHRLIVSSATYRQSSHASENLFRLDPNNRLLARGPRFRVNAEVVRDSMLRASGLLSQKMYGPGVYPPQPAGVTALAYGNTKWNVSQGEDRYRRSLYTFSKRTMPFAAFSVFDAPSGENCLAKRDRSNSPLQALTMLNDPMYVEMSRVLAKRALEKTTPSETVVYIFRRLLTRPPEKKELATILEYQRAQLARLKSGKLDPRVLCADKNGSPEWASWVMVARAIMNVDEAITKQ